MAQPIEYTNLKANRYVPVSSRYANSQVIVLGEQGVITFETYKRKEIPLRADDKFSIVPPGEEYRPDKTSMRAYGTVDYWWKIMEASNIKDIFEYKTGTNIRIPSILNLF